MINHPSRQAVLEKLRRRYARAGQGHKGKLLDQALELLGYHRNAANRRENSRKPVEKRFSTAVQG